MDYMTMHPKYGWLVTGPSNSPENSFYTGHPEDGHQQLSMGPTMDQVLVRDLLAFCVKAAQTLGVDKELQQKWKTALGQLPPLMIGKKAYRRSGWRTLRRRAGASPSVASICPVSRRPNHPASYAGTSRGVE